MRAFRKLLVASLKEFLRDRTTLSFTIILPLLMVAFFGFAFSGASSRLNVGLTVHGSEFAVQGSRLTVHGSNPRADTSTIGSRVLRTLRGQPNVKVEQGTASTELARLHDGTIDVVVVLDHAGHGPVRILYDRGDGPIALAAQALAADLRRGISTTRMPSSATGSVAVSREPATASRAPGANAGETTTVNGGPRTVNLSTLHGLSNSRLDFVIPGILATAIMWLGIFAAIPLVQQREQQVLRRLAVTPLSRFQLVGAQVLSRLLVSLAQGVFILAAARLLFGVPIGAEIGSTAGAVGVLAALVLLGALGFVAIGYALAALSSTQSGAHAWAQLLTMPMLLLAGVFFPVAVMPGILRPLIAVLPLTYLADALRQTALSGQHFVPIGVDLAVLATWAVLPLLVAARYFRWS